MLNLSNHTYYTYIHIYFMYIQNNEFRQAEPLKLFLNQLSQCIILQQLTLELIEVAIQVIRVKQAIRV